MNPGKYFLLLILFATTSLDCISGELTPIGFRLEFQQAIEDEDLCRKFIKELENIEEEEFIYRAYRAAAVMSLAKFTSFPTDKLRYFYKGKEELELAIQEMPQSVELRFLRLAVQDFIPGILLYNNQEEDLNFILDQLHTIEDEFYKKEVENYLVHMGHCEKSEAVVISN